MAGNILETIEIAEAFSPFVFVTVLTSSSLFGLPITIMFERLRIVSGFAYVGAGSAIGFLMMMLSLLVLDLFSGETSVLTIIGFAVGGVTSALWWVMTRPKRLPHSS